MIKQETARVLAKIQLGDNRQVDHLVLDEWHDTIGHLDFDDAIAAVKLHRQSSTDWLMPAHVISGARRVKSDRASEARRNQPAVELPGWIQQANERAALRRLEIETSGMLKTVDDA